MNLVIVESPAKAKTINKYLGKDYLVLASGFEPDISKLLFKNYHKNTYAGYLAIRKIFTEKLNFIEEENITLFFGKNSHLVTYPIDNNKSKNAVFIVKQNLDLKILEIFLIQLFELF